jgi:hypothetical protein
VDFPGYDFLPKNITTGLETKAPNTSKWLKAVAAEKSVNHIWDAQESITAYKKRLAQK